MRGKINTNDSFIQKLQSDVEKYKTNPERRKELMDYQMKLDDMRYVASESYDGSNERYKLGPRCHDQFIPFVSSETKS